MWIKTEHGWKLIVCASSIAVPDEQYRLPQANTRWPVRDKIELACLMLPNKWKR